MDTKNLTTAELAERLRTSPETIRYWRHLGRGPKSWKPGRLVLYAVEDVEAWEADERATAALVRRGPAGGGGYDDA